MVQFLPIDGDTSLPEAFLDVARQVYADDPFWLPEDRAQLRTQFSRHNSWFQGARRACIAHQEDQARLAGFLPGQTICGEPVAFFGFWEAVDQLAINQALFQAVETWAREHGAKRLYGPINFSTFGSNRLRLDNFAHGCFPGEPWNPPYYPELLAQLGYRCAMLYHSFPVPIADLIASAQFEHEQLQPMMAAAQLSIDTLSPALWLERLDDFYDLVDQIFGQNFAYTPIDRAAFRAAFGPGFASKLCPHASVIATSHDGRIAGFFLAVPDYAPVVRQGALAQRRDDFLFARDFAQLPRPRAILAKTLGVHPDFRGLGLSTVLTLELTRRAQAHYDTLIGALIREDNHSMRFPTRHIGAMRSYSLYEKAL